MPRPTHPVRRALTLVLAAAPLAGAPLVGARAIGPGEYSVSGTGPDGTAYTGTAVVSGGGGGIWQVSETVNGQRMVGRGVGDAGHLAITFVIGGAPVSALYTAMKDGSYVGIWAEPGAKKASPEILRPR